MPVVSNIPPAHPRRAEILRLLTGLELPDGVTLTVSASLNRIPGWELKFTSASADRVAVGSVTEEDGPTGVLVAAARLLATIRPPA